MLILFLTACLTQDTFPDRFGEGYCLRLEECFKADFEGAYDDQGECIDDMVDGLDDADVEDCDFDADEAAECLKDVEEADCDELLLVPLTDCDKVYDCDSPSTDEA